MGYFRKLFSDKGEEIPDPTPAEIPVGFKKPENIQQLIRRLVKDEALQADLRRNGIETFDEADDFDVGDDYDPKSPYEEDFDPDVPFIGAREGELTHRMVEERPLNEKHIKVLKDFAEGKLAKQEVKKDGEKSVS